MNAGAVVLGYVRVSTEEQARGGYGLAAQEAAIRAECDRRGWSMELIADEGASAASLERAGLRSALERIAAGRAEGLVVAKLDRLSRSVQDFAGLLKWFDRAGARLVALDLGIDTSEPGGRLVAHVFAAVAEWERETIGQRTRDGLTARRAQGFAISRPAVADTPDLRERIAAMRADGMTLQAICDVLNAEGVPTPRGGVLWRPSSLQGATGYRRRPRESSTELPPLKRRRRAA